MFGGRRTSRGGQLRWGDRMGWETHRHARPNSGLARHGQVSSDQLRHPARDGQPDSESRIRSVNGIVSLMERLEYRIDLALFDTHSRICDFNIDAITVWRRLHLHVDVALGSKFYRVVKNILKDALNLGAVTDNRCLSLGDAHIQAQVLLPNR